MIDSFNDAIREVFQQLLSEVRSSLRWTPPYIYPGLFEEQQLESRPMVDHHGRSPRQDMETAQILVRSILGEEMVEPEGQWWLSFADADLPEGSQFLGVAIVKARGIASAAQTAHRLGINPGGEVMGMQVPQGKQIPSEYCNHLLTRTEAESVPFEIVEREG